MTRRHVERTVIKRMEDVPLGVPRRELSAAGYVWLVWKLGYYNYARCYEHRLVTGFQSGHVHHLNGIKSDNRLENLEIISAHAHIWHHGLPGCRRIDDLSRDGIAALFHAGFGAPTIAATLEVSTEPIQRILNELGLRRSCGRVPKRLRGLESRPGSQRDAEI